MTFAEAYARLLAAWPDVSFSIDVSAWHYEHLPHDPPAVEYRVWHGGLHESFQGPTLEIAMALALGVPADEAGLAAVDRVIGPLTLVAP